MSQHGASRGTASSATLADTKRSAATSAALGAALDYVAAQAYAAAFIAERCLELDAADPYAAARPADEDLLWAFELDPASGLQIGHRLSVVRWRAGRQELLLPNAA